MSGKYATDACRSHNCLCQTPTRAGGETVENRNSNSSYQIFKKSDDFILKSADMSDADKLSLIEKMEETFKSKSSSKPLTKKEKTEFEKIVSTVLLLLQSNDQVTSEFHYFDKNDVDLKKRIQETFFEHGFVAEKETDSPQFVTVSCRM